MFFFITLTQFEKIGMLDKFFIPQRNLKIKFHFESTVLIYYSDKMNKIRKFEHAFIKLGYD